MFGNLYTKESKNFFSEPLAGTNQPGTGPGSDSRTPLTLFWKSVCVKCTPLRRETLLPLSLSMSINSSMIGLVGTYPYHTLVVLLFSYILFKQLKKRTSANPNRLPLPPGPKGYPLLANLFDMPIDRPWLVYDEWRKTYGKYFSTIGFCHGYSLMAGQSR